MTTAQDEDKSPHDAAAKVFRIAELAELILHGVYDAPTLVHARRVNKMFKEVIDRDMQQYKQKYWLERDAAQLPSRWYEEEEDGYQTLYPEAGPEEIELNPWAARGCIPKLSLQYKDALLEDYKSVFDTSVMMVFGTDIFSRSQDWWHNMEILRLKEQKRNVSVTVIVNDADSPLQSDGLSKLLGTGKVFDVPLHDAEEQYTIKGMIEYAFSLTEVRRSVLGILEDI